MLISQFAEATGLSVDTVRFYVREGLFAPTRSVKGGSRPYQEFSQRDVRIAAGVSIGRALGLSLADIRTLVVERRSGRQSRAQGIRLMELHQERLQARFDELKSLLGYMEAKIAWMKGHGGEPIWPATQQNPIAQKRRGGRG